MKISAQVVLINEEGLVLGVSRKTDHNDFGLPGGKMDPEDANIGAAALREVKEETGLDIYDLDLVFAMHKNGYMGYTYLAKYSGEINHNEPHVVEWLPFSVIMQGSFGRFNELVSESLDDMGVIYSKKAEPNKREKFLINFHKEISSSKESGIITKASIELLKEMATGIIDGTNFEIKSNEKNDMINDSIGYCCTKILECKYTENAKQCYSYFNFIIRRYLFGTGNEINRGNK